MDASIHGPLQLSVVIPAFNEALRIEATLIAICAYLDAQQLAAEIIVVDDGSRDATAELVERRSAADHRIRLLGGEPNAGKGAAVRRGVLAAHGELVLISDADLSTPIAELAKLQAALAGCDLAIGSRAVRTARIVKRQPLFRVLMGKTFNKIVRLVAVGGYSDTQCGFKLLRRAAGRAIFSRTRIDGFAFDVELLLIAARHRLRVAEVGIVWENSEQSRVDPLRHSLQMFRDTVRIRYYDLKGYYRSETAL